MKIAIIIVNFRTAQLAIECLKSIEFELQKLPEITVYVVDEFSQDNSVEHISSAIEANGWEQWAELMQNQVNLGFAHGNNTVIRRVLSNDILADYVLLLNPDTRVLQNSILSLASFLHKNPDIGIAGSQLLDKNGNAQHAAFRFPSIISEFERGLRLGLMTRMLSRWTVTLPFPNSPTRVDWVAGTSMMIRRDVLDKVGLLDEDYFLYYEEVDYMRRAASKKIQTWTVPTSRIVHVGGQSTGVIDGHMSNGEKPNYLYKSRYLYFFKNHGVIYYWFANISWILGTVLDISRLIVTRRQAKWVWRELFRFTVFSLFQSNRDTAR